MPGDDGGAAGGAQRVLAVRAPVPTFDAEQFDLYLTNLEMWSFTSVTPKNMRGAMLFQSLPNNHVSGIKQRISDQMTVNDLKGEESFQRIIDILKDAFEKEKEAENYAVFKEFLHMKRKDDEAMLPFITRFCGSKVKAAKHNIKLGDTTKAYHLLEASRISEQDKRAVLAQLVGKVDSEGDETVFKAAVAALKTILGEAKNVDISGGDGIKHLETGEHVFLTHEEEEVLATFRQKRNFQKKSTQQKFYKNPVQKPRNPIDPNTGMIMRCSSCDAKTHLVKDCYDTYENVRARLKAQTSKGQQLVAEDQLSDDDSRPVFFTQGSGSIEDVLLQIETNQLKTLGGHTSGFMLIDCGCTGNVAGTAWIDDYIEGLDEDDQKNVTIKELGDKEKKSFRFGGGDIYLSDLEYTIPGQVGDLKCKIKCNVVHAPIPLLFSKAGMKRAGVSLDFVNDRMLFHGQSVTLQDLGVGHYGVYIRPKGPQAINLENSLISDGGSKPFKFPDGFDEQVKVMRKLHLQFGHCPKKTLTKILKEANSWFAGAPAVLDKIFSLCKACKLHAPTQPRPVVASGSHATAPGQVVAIDLKDKKVGPYKFILYGVDMFSSLVFAVFLKTKNTDEVVDNIFKYYAASGTCIPQYIYSDNGNEFCSNTFREMCEMLGIEPLTTAPYSPWSNGKVEKIHHIVDSIYDKVSSSHPQLSPQVVLSWSCFSKNQWPSSTLGGFSAFQLHYGKTPSMPDNTSSSLPNLSGVVSSKVVLDHMKAMEAGHRAHSEALFSRKIREALKHKIRAQQRIFNSGDKVYYKRDQIKGPAGHCYRGPAVIIGKRGQVYWLVHQNKVLSCAATRLLSVGDAEDFSSKSTPDDKFQSRNVPPSERVALDEQVSNPDDEEPTWIGIDDHGDPPVPVIENEPIAGNGEVEEDIPDLNVNPEDENFDAQDLPLNRDQHELPQVLNPQQDEGVDQQQHAEQAVAPLIDPQFHENPQSYPKTGDRIEYLDNGVWEQRTVLSRWKRDSDYFNVRPQEEADHGIHLDTAVWRFEDEGDGDEDVAVGNFIFDELVTVIPLSDQNSDEVRESKEAELRGWQEFGAKIDVPYTGQKLLSSRWVVVRKENPDGTTRVKSRLVIRGCEMPPEDRPRSDSPCAGRDSLKVTLAISATKGWDIKLVDVKNAFLQSHELLPKERIHVYPPKDLRQPGICWELLRPVYGDTSASRRWWITLSGFLQELGGTVSKLDHCVISFYDDSQKLLAVVCCWVDDLYISGTTSQIEFILKKIETYFTIGKVHTNVFRYTGLQLEHKSNGIYLDQLSYIRDLETTPVRLGNRDEKCTAEETTLLRHNVGGVLWVAGATRPDCAWTACEISTQFKCATLGALRDSNKLISKLKLSEVKILYPRFSSFPEFLIWADASLGNLPNKLDTGGGYIVFLVDNDGHSAPIGWVSNKIRRKVGSTLSAECLILLQAVDHAFYLRGLLAGILNIEPSRFKMKAMSDSKNLVANLHSVHQPKEYRLRFEIAQLQQYVSEGLEVKHVQGCSQLADPLSKRTASSTLLLQCLNDGKIPEQCRV